jgi:hypothetical protein
MRNNRGRPLTDEWIEKLADCVEDGWPLREIEDTFGTSHRTMKKHFPDYQGADHTLSGEISQLLQKMGWTNDLAKHRSQTWNDRSFNGKTIWHKGGPMLVRE